MTRPGPSRKGGTSAKRSIGIGQALLAQGSAAEARESGSDRKQAREQARKARDLYAELKSADQVKEIDAWLSAHP